MSTLKQTVLSEWHQQQGAKMVPFAGYSMPVQYTSGVLQEHVQTRSKAGLFDVSHMGQIQILGEDVAVALERLFPANLLDLPEGRQTYSLLLNAEGGVIDDLMICRRDHDFMLVVNAACKEKDLAFIREKLGSDVQINMIDDRALLALQGPQASAVLESLGADVEHMQFMDGDWLEIRGIECWATRSGYTGEDGFELSVANDKAVQLADVLAADERVLPVGLGARDTLRLEAGLCLYGHELDEHTTPVEAGLRWAVAKARRSDGKRPGGFVGAAAILEQMQADALDKKRIGLVSQGRAPVRDGTPLFSQDGTPLGSICSGGFSPSLKKPIAMAYTEPNVSVGDCLYAELRGKKVPMDVTKMPFVTHRYYRG